MPPSLSWNACNNWTKQSGVANSWWRSISDPMAEKYWSTSSCEWPEARHLNSIRFTLWSPTRVPKSLAVTLFLTSRLVLSLWQITSNSRMSIFAPRRWSEWHIKSQHQLASFFKCGKLQQSKTWWPWQITALISRVGRMNPENSFEAANAVRGNLNFEWSMASVMRQTVFEPSGRVVSRDDALDFQ